MAEWRRHEKKAYGWNKFPTRTMTCTQRNVLVRSAWTKARFSSSTVLFQDHDNSAVVSDLGLDVTNFSCRRVPLSEIHFFLDSLKNFAKEHSFP